jgi:hypothetical protein
LDPVWQFECTSPFASGSGAGLAEAAVTQPTGIANDPAATKLTSNFFIALSFWDGCCTFHFSHLPARDA